MKAKKMKQKIYMHKEKENKNKYFSCNLYWILLL